ncbi:MAG TPA: flagellar protein [Enterovirga sp.]|jgi:flagellin
MSAIVLSSASRSGLLATQEIGSRLASTQLRLSTGLRTNSALDNPTRFFTASDLTGRARDLTGLLDNISNGVHTLRTAQGTLGSISRLLDSAKALAQAALAEPADAAAPATPVTPAPTPPASGTAAVLTAGTSFNGNHDFSGSKRVIFTLNDGVNSTTITLDAVTLSGLPDLTKVKRADVVAAINAQIAADPTPAGVTASSPGSQIVLTSTATGSTAQVRLTNLAGNDDDLGFGTGTAPQAASGTGGAPAAPAATPAPVAAPAENARTALARQYNAILAQIDQLARDGSYNGVNLLTSARTKLHIGFNERDTAHIDVAGVDMTFAGLGLAAIDLTTAAAAFQTNTEITAALDAVSNATVRLRANTAAFGSGLTVVQNREDFTKKLANILQTGSANLVNADLNEEAATSQALATRQSLATSSLTLANQAHQSVLRLLQ